MGLPAIKPATYNDILALPEHVVGEIIRGVLRTHPRPAPKHARAYSSLGGVSCTARLTMTGMAPAAGGFWTNRSCTWAQTSWSPISRAGK